MRYFFFKFILLSTLLIINLLITFPISDVFIDITSHYPVEKYFWMIPFYLVGYLNMRLLTHRMVTTNEVILILKANFFALVAIFFVSSIANLQDDITRIIILVYFLMNNLNSLWSYLIKKYIFRFAFLRQPVFVICDTRGLKNIHSWFAQGNPFGYDVKTILNVDEEHSYEVDRKINFLIDHEKYDSVIISMEHNSLFGLTDLVNHIQKRVRKVIVLPKMTTLSIINGELISSVHHKGMAFYIKNNLLNPVDRFIKQGFDLCVAILLILLFIPLLLWLYSLVFISTKGHPIFAHERIGFGGRRFKVYKFRTMYLDANQRLKILLENSEENRRAWKKDFKLKDDPRITKIGRFLRKTSLDELPQFINVLRGEMSLVGPRPITQDEIVKYGDYFEYFTAVKPGISGLWQVSGRNDIEYDERVQLDVWYVRNWSIELDIQILIKTVLVVLGRKGSY